MQSCVGWVPLGLHAALMSDEEKQQAEEQKEKDRETQEKAVVEYHEKKSADIAARESIRVEHGEYQAGHRGDSRGSRQGRSAQGGLVWRCGKLLGGRGETVQGKAKEGPREDRNRGDSSLCHDHPISGPCMICGFVIIMPL